MKSGLGNAPAAADGVGKIGVLTVTREEDWAMQLRGTADAAAGGGSAIRGAGGGSGIRGTGGGSAIGGAGGDSAIRGNGGGSGSAACGWATAEEAGRWGRAEPADSQETAALCGSSWAKGKGAGA